LIDMIGKKPKITNRKWWLVFLLVLSGVIFLGISDEQGSLQGFAAIVVVAGAIYLGLSPIVSVLWDKERMKRRKRWRKQLQLSNFDSLATRVKVLQNRRLVPYIMKLEKKRLKLMTESGDVIIDESLSNIEIKVPPYSAGSMILKVNSRKISIVFYDYIEAGIHMARSVTVSQLGGIALNVASAPLFAQGLKEILSGDDLFWLWQEVFLRNGVKVVKSRFKALTYNQVIIGGFIGTLIIMALIFIMVVIYDR